MHLVRNHLIFGLNFLVSEEGCRLTVPNVAVAVRAVNHLDHLTILAMTVASVVVG